MDPIFTEEQLDRMSSRDMRSLLKIMTRHQQKQEETLQKQEGIKNPTSGRTEKGTGIPERHAF